MVSSLYAAVRALLRENGCCFVRQGKGSHEIWHSHITNRNVTVPVTVNKTGTANAILKQAGITGRI
ncbi:MAG: type II toxin-antitoxin system HicA family toxin [Zoogloeaceae bacterium]|jgi:predicted RNA binding protein YcfA (HicA-like mRNA interferase family)|nr:type II toxin-antitoxin system HicA family toxin [Zoogloeaceae bacterium]